MSTFNWRTEIELSSFSLLSHPARLLSDHIHGVWKNADFQFDKTSTDFPSFNRLDLKTVLKIACLFHDFGKSTPWFQRYIRNIEGKYSADDRSLRQHGLISAFMVFGILNSIFPTNLFLPALGFMIVRRHHGNLESFQNFFTITDEEFELCFRQKEKIDYEEYRRIVQPWQVDHFVQKDFIEQTLLEIQSGKLRRFKPVKKLDSTFTLDHYFVVNLLYSLLINSDKRDAIFHAPVSISSAILPSSQVESYQKTLSANSSQINAIRNSIFNSTSSSIDHLHNPDMRIFSINTPTGTGKTINALNAALKIREKYNLSHIVYCLPFTSVIDQNFDVFDTIRRFAGLPNGTGILLKHHHLAEICYHSQDIFEREIVYNPDEALHLIEGWESHIVVTTFVQFILSLISNDNASLRKFQRFSNAVIILDEVQSISHEYWQVVKESLLKLTQVLNSRIILVTATMPLIFSEEHSEIVELVPSKFQIFNSLARIQLDLADLEQGYITWDLFCERMNLLVDQNASRDILIVVNTIRCAREIYLYFKGRNMTHELVYLSSHIIPRHRIERINYIRQRNHNRPILVISTQLVEAGVDIDLDLVVRDFAPLDSIFQTSGRCNREGHQDHIGTVKIISIKDSQNRKPSEMIYDRFLLEKTRKVLTGKRVIPESDFYLLSQQYYAELSESGSQAISGEILSDMRNLSYEDDNGQPLSNKLKLIDQDYCYSVFVEIDEIAEQFWNKYTEVVSSENNIKKRSLLKESYRNLADYIINIPKKCLNRLPEYGIYRLKRSMVNEYYDSITGFNPESLLPEENSTLFFG